MASYYKWVLRLLFCVLTGVLLASLANPGTSLVALLCVIAAFVLAGVCGGELVIKSNEGGRFASEYLTGEWGHVVRINSVKIGLAWWQWRIDQERQRHDTNGSTSDIR